MFEFGNAMGYEPDLWWLPREARPDQLFVGLAHTDPLGDEDDLGDLIQSVSAAGKPSERQVLYSLSQIAWWREVWNDENVYRSLRLFDGTGEPVVLGPFYLDIDADDVDRGGPDLDGALVAARDAMGTLRLAPVDVRVWFTGHKGFNVEARPSAVGVADGRSWAAVHESIMAKLREIGLPGRPARANNYVQPNVCVDSIFNRFHVREPRHTHLRLAGSKNVWLAEDGSKRWRIKRQVSLEELFSKDAHEIAGTEES